MWMVYHEAENTKKILHNTEIDAFKQTKINGFFD